YYANMYWQGTNTKINDSSSVPVGSQIEFRAEAHKRSDIFWFGTGHTWDSPYGHWVAGAGVPLVSNGSFACNESDVILAYYSGYKREDSIHVPLSINPPSKTYTHGGTAGLSCNAAGNLCTVTGPGSITSSVNFGDTTGRFYYRVNMFTGYKKSCLYNNTPLSRSRSGPTYNLPVPAQTIPFTLTAVGAGNSAPDAPTITGPSTGLTSIADTFSFTATDPDGDNIRYEIDWDNNSTVDETTSYAPSGSTDSSSRAWSTIGNHTFQVRTADDQGGVSGWSNHTINLSVPVATLDVTPVSNDFGNVNTGLTNTLQFTVTNTGAGTLTGNVTGLAAPYSCTAGCSYSLGAGASQTVDITFAPVTGGNQIDTAVFDGAGTVSRPLTGLGVSPLVASCSVAPITGDINTNTTWTANAAGGVAPYTYTWSGDAPLSGQTNQIETVQYNTAGAKSGLVTVTDSLLNTTGPIACTNSFTANNTAFPNLTSQNLQETSANPLNQGVSLTFTAQVLNNGSLPTGIGFTDVFEYRYGGVLGNYAGFSPLDSELNPALAAGASDVDSTSYNIPAGHVGQELFIQHCVDSNNDIAEDPTNETAVNHCSQISLGIVAALPSGSIQATSCIILVGGTSCSSNIIWNTADFVGSPAIKQGATQFDSANNQTSPGIPRSVTPNNRTFTLEDDGSTFSQTVTAGVGCIGGTVWTNTSCHALPNISMTSDSEIVRSQQAADVTIIIDANFDLTCTLYGALSGTFNHTASAAPIVYPPRTTNLLTATQVARVECVDSLLPMVNGGAEVRIDVVPAVEEV
ncbi:MAG: hypothetical protein LR008_01635, partial [Candidatus Pacebacteria bacterium]|nr:hypothetical protein [Candidatus Paceibacterota bacterium]